MQCNIHQKSFVGMCQNCGKNMCKLCVAKIKGIRVWCTQCSVALDKFPELTVHAPPKEVAMQDEDAEWYDLDAKPEQPERVSARSYAEKMGYVDFAAVSVRNRR